VLHADTGEVRRLAHRGEKDGKVSFWLQPRDDGTDEVREKWEWIGSGLSVPIATAKEDA
jgi:hypothetical protein